MKTNNNFITIGSTSIPGSELFRSTPTIEGGRLAAVVDKLEPGINASNHVLDLAASVLKTLSPPLAQDLRNLEKLPSALAAPPAWLARVASSPEFAPVLIFILYSDLFGRTPAERRVWVRIYITLVAAESNFNRSAKNPKSTASGALQLLNGTKVGGRRTFELFVRPSPLMGVLLDQLSRQYALTSATLTAIQTDIGYMLMLKQRAPMVVQRYSSLPQANGFVRQMKAILSPIQSFGDLMLMGICTALHTEGFYSLTNPTHLAQTVHIKRIATDMRFFANLERIPSLFSWKGVFDGTLVKALYESATGDPISEAFGSNISRSHARVLFNKYMAIRHLIPFDILPRGTGVVISKPGRRQQIKLTNGSILPARMHYGFDLGGRVGQPLFSLGTGSVLRIGRDPEGFGRYVDIGFLGSDRFVRYAHMNEVFVRVGDTILDGYIFGTLGKSGNVEGPHVHIELLDAKGKHVIDSSRWPADIRDAVNAIGC